MKILVLARTLAPLGGAEIYLRSLLPLLAGQGHEIIIGYAQGDGVEGLHTVQLDPTNAENLESLLKTGRPDRIFINTPVPLPWLAPASRQAPTFAYIHDFHPVCPGLAKFLRTSAHICTRPMGLGCVPQIYIQRCASARHPASVRQILAQSGAALQAYQNLPHLLVASEFMRALLGQNGVDPMRVTVLPQFTTVRPADAARTQPRPATMLFAGRLEPEKGLLTLLKALQSIRRPWQLYVAGDGSQRQACEAFARQSGMAERIRFFGWLDDAALASLYLQAALVVLPSLWPEPFGRVGLDALAYGRPVVAFDVGGISEWLADGQTGLLAAPHDSTDLARRIETLLDQPALAAAYGRAGAESVRARYTPEAHLAGFQQLLEPAPGTGA